MAPPRAPARRGRMANRWARRSRRALSPPSAGRTSLSRSPAKSSARGERPLAAGRGRGAHGPSAFWRRRRGLMFETQIAATLPADFAERLNCLQGVVFGVGARHRHAQGLRVGAQPRQCRDAAHRWRIGGSDSFEPHRYARPCADHRRTRSPAGTSITASASTAWRRR